MLLPLLEIALLMMVAPYIMEKDNMKKQIIIQISRAAN